MTPRKLIAPAALVASLALVAPVTASAQAASTADQQRTTSSSAAKGRAARPVDPEAGIPQVFAHRGASGYRPEHTLAAYQLAIKMGADYIEPDLVSTKDGVLVARHENEISTTTDVAKRPEFAARKTTKTIDGVVLTGWFTEDFTLAELKTLRAVERLPGVRPDNTKYDGRFQVPTFAEVLELAKQAGKQEGRTIGVAPETKHPTYFDSIGLSLEEPMLATLRKARMDGKRSKILIQSFETTNLRELDKVTDLPLEQLLDATGGPFDLKAQGTTYAQLATRSGLRGIASYADWVGPNKNLVLPPNSPGGTTTTPSNLVRDAHAFGLDVVVFTLRNENQFMAPNFRIGTDPNADGDVLAEMKAFLDAGVDGFFADYPDTGVFARDTWLAENS